MSKRLNGAISHFPKTHEWRQQYFQSRRIADLHRLFRHRYRAEFYEFPQGDDSAWEDLVILLQHYCICDPGRVSTIIRTRAPWIVGTQLELRLYAEVTEAAGAAFYTAAKLATVMNLTEADRTMLGIRTIGAVDVSPEQRKANRKKRDRDRKARQRRDSKKPTRAEYLAANAKSREKPWLAEGISRRTWYRRQMAQVVPLYKNRDSYNTEDAPVPRQTVARKRKPSSGTAKHQPDTSRRASRHKQKSKISETGRRLTRVTKRREAA
jgi:hypothetical protein